MLNVRTVGYERFNFYFVFSASFCNDEVREDLCSYRQRFSFGFLIMYGVGEMSEATMCDEINSCLMGSIEEGDITQENIDDSISRLHDILSQADEIRNTAGYLRDTASSIAEDKNNEIDELDREISELNERVDVLEDELDTLRAEEIC